MSDIASLGIRVTTSGVKDASTDLDKLAASGDKAAKSTDGLNKSFNQAGGIEKPAKAAAQAFNQQTAALAKLAGQIDPTVAKLDKLDKLQAQLGKFKKSGMISADDFAALNGVLDKSRESIGGAGKAMHSFSLSTAQSRRELGYITKDLATGQYGRLSQSLSTLAVNSNAVSLVMSPLGLGLAGVTVSVGALALAYVKGAGEAEEYNKQLILTGNYAVTTSAGLAGMAMHLDTVSGVTQHSAAAALATVVGTGRFAANQLEEVAGAALKLQQATGQSIDKTVADFVKLSQDPVKAILALNETQHFLRASVLDQIQAMEDQGRTADAAALAIKAYSDTISERTKDVNQNLGTLERTLNSVKKGWSEFWDAAYDIGRQNTPSLQIKQLQQDIEGAKSGHGVYQGMSDASVDAFVKRTQDKIAQLRATDFSDVKGGTTGDPIVDTSRERALLDFQRQGLQYADKRERMEADIAKAKADGLKAGADQIVIDERIARIRESYAEKTASSAKQRAAPNFRVQDMAELRKEIEAEGKLMDQRIRSSEAVKAYRNSLQDMLATRQATIDLQVASVGMGQREIAQQQALIAIDEDYNRQKSSLERQQRNSTSEIDKAGFAEQLSDLKRYHDDRVKIEQEGFARSSAARDNWALGAQAATKDFMDGAKDIAGATYSVVTNIYTGLADNMADFFTKGRADWKGFVADILKQIVRIQTAKAVAGIATSLSGSFGFQGGTSASTFAKGGVFDSPSLSAYSNGVYSSPQPFKFAKGAGVFGEAGPEAIMPLSRGPDGKLGVKASGGVGGGITLNQTIVVDSKGGASENTSGSGDDNLRKFAGKMKGIAQQAILDEQRPGGSLWRMGQH